MRNKTENETAASAVGTESLDADLLKIESLIATAVRLIEEGRVVDLTALQERTKHLCDAVVQLPSEDAQPLIPTMESVLTQLDTLTENLTKRYGDLPALSSRIGSDAAASVGSRRLKNFP